MIILDMIKDGSYSPEDIVDALVNFYAIMNSESLGDIRTLEKCIGGIKSELGLDITAISILKDSKIDKKALVEFNIRLAATMLLARTAGDVKYSKVMNAYSDLMTALVDLKDDYNTQTDTIMNVVDSKLELIRKYVINSVDVKELDKISDVE